jgi:hypothetical protein
MKEYGPVTINGDIPKTLKLALICIDRVGFPIIAFCLMFWMAYSSLAKVSDAITANSVALIEFRASSQEFQRTVLTEHRAMYENQSKIIDRISNGR